MTKQPLIIRAAAYLLSALALMSPPGGAWAQNADVTLQQLTHRAFTSAEGAPSNIYAMAQTSDGTLWMGGNTGLTRFDGVRFAPYPGASDEPLRSTNVSALASSPDGGLWIGFRLGGITFLKSGHTHNYTTEDGLPMATVGQFALDRDGTVWAATRRGLFHLEGDHWSKVALDTPERCSGAPTENRCFGALIDRRGTLWVATTNALLARAAGEREFRDIGKLELQTDMSADVLTEGPDGSIWISGAQLTRVNRGDISQAVGAVSVAGLSGHGIGAKAFDQSGNLWLAPLISQEHDLARISAGELAKGTQQPSLPADKVSSLDRPPDAVSSILRDREENIWIGTVRGLERLSRGNIQRLPTPCENPALAAGDAGAVWVACWASDAKLTELRDGAVVNELQAPAFTDPARQSGGSITVLYRDPDGILWFGRQSMIGHVSGGRAIGLPLPPQLQGREIQALMRDGHGALWASIVGKGVYRYMDGVWSANGASAELPQDPAIVETAAEGDVLWFGYPGSKIARLHGNQVQVFAAAQGLETGNVQSILSDAPEVWAGGERGLARFVNGGFVMIQTASGAPFRGISGIVRAPKGDLWLNSIDGIVRIPRDEINHATQDAAYRVHYDLFNYLDGVPGSGVQLRPQPSAVVTTEGRAWFLMSGGVVSVDVAHLVHNAVLPPVAIWSLTAGTKKFTDLASKLSLPVKTTNLRIEYSAGSLTVPERVQFRYKLEGSDHDWQDAGSRREALYTNLGPGHYRFQVIASNNDGVWNTQGKSIEFSIPPAFYQTRWFYLASALACLGLLTALYKVRVRRVAAQVRGHLEARLTERERIARELHDTLLQGMQGLIWRFQAAADRIPPDAPARQLMEQSLDRADRLLGEGRDRVKGLRPASGDAPDLAQVLADEGEHLAQLRPARFKATAQGAARELHPIVREEGLLIGREALANAFRHSGAKDVEAEVTYGESFLHIRIRDNGRGIPKELLDDGRTGHFGLIGMRERAKKLGGHIEIWSKLGAGTEIDLRVPADVAYLRLPAPNRNSRSWFGIFGSAT